MINHITFSDERDNATINGARFKNVKKHDIYTYIYLLMGGESKLFPY